MFFRFHVHDIAANVDHFYDRADLERDIELLIDRLPGQ